MNAKTPPVSGRSVKLQDIAEHLGVAVSTVSRALSGHKAISVDTKNAVRAAATELGYRVPTQGRATRRPRTKLVGVVVGALHNSFMTTLLTHLHDALQEQGYMVTLLIDSMHDTEQLLTLRPFIDSYLEGLIFATATLDSPVVAEMVRRGVPTVLVVRSVDDVAVDIVEVDNVHAGCEAMRHLHEMGHRSIGMAMGPRNTSTSRDRVQGCLKWLSAVGIEPHQVPVVWGDYTTESGYSSTIQLLDQPQQVTAIVAGNDMIALGVLEAARRRSIDVPRQLSVIGFDDMPLAGSPLVSLTSIQLPVRAMARMAAHRLVERIRGRGGLPVRDVLPIQVVKRETTGPR